MIIPCMNSTSACDGWSNEALVEGGSVLLGLPGAPGCTTTGVAGSACCADTVEEKIPPKQKNPVRALVASRKSRSAAHLLAICSSRLRQKRYSPHFGA